MSLSRREWCVCPSSTHTVTPESVRGELSVFRFERQQKQFFSNPQLAALQTISLWTDLKLQFAVDFLVWFTLLFRAISKSAFHYNWRDVVVVVVVDVVVVTVTIATARYSHLTRNTCEYTRKHSRKPNDEIGSMFLTYCLFAAKWLFFFLFQFLIVFTAFARRRNRSTLLLQWIIIYRRRLNNLLCDLETHRLDGGARGTTKEAKLIVVHLLRFRRMIKNRKWTNRKWKHKINRCCDCQFGRNCYTQTPTPRSLTKRHSHTHKTMQISNGKLIAAEHQICCVTFASVFVFILGFSLLFRSADCSEFHKTVFVLKQFWQLFTIYR